MAASAWASRFFAFVAFDIIRYCKSTVQAPINRFVLSPVVSSARLQRTEVSMPSVNLLLSFNLPCPSVVQIQIAWSQSIRRIHCGHRALFGDNHTTQFLFLEISLNLFWFFFTLISYRTGPMVMFVMFAEAPRGCAMSLFPKR